jgi:maleate cis-trans isomerase
VCNFLIENGSAVRDDEIAVLGIQQGRNIRNYRPMGATNVAKEICEFFHSTILIICSLLSMFTL